MYRKGLMNVNQIIKSKLAAVLCDAEQKRKKGRDDNAECKADQRKEIRNK